MYLGERGNMPEGTCEYRVRTYRDGDDIKLISLFNEAYKGYAGFVPRTVEYWRWCCKNRPGVSAESVVIACYEQKIVGYAVVGESGNIWELCYDTDFDVKLIVSKLLRWSLDYIQRTGGDHVELSAPLDDQNLREVCRELGFAEQPLPSMTISILDFPQLIKEIINSKKEIPAALYNEMFMFRLKNAPSWMSDCFTIQIQRDKISVTEGKCYIPSVTVDTDVPTLTSCVFGTAKIFKMILIRRIRVRPLWKSPKVLKFLSMLSLKDPWYIPEGDIG